MKDKINAKLEEKRTKRVQVQTKLPNVNKDLFLKLKDLETTKKKSKAANLVKKTCLYLLPGVPGIVTFINKNIETQIFQDSLTLTKKLSCW